MFNFIDYYQGIGSPRPFLYHQILIQNTCTNLNFECRPRGLYAYAEATVTEDYNDLAPDISIYTAGENPRHVRGDLLVIIEFTRHKTLKRDIRKCDSILSRFPDIDCFVIDYERDIIYMANSETNGWITSDEYEMASRYLLKPIDEYFHDYCC